MQNNPMALADSGKDPKVQSAKRKDMATTMVIPQLSSRKENKTFIATFTQLFRLKSSKNLKL
jgi:hypothetical protein